MLIPRIFNAIRMRMRVCIFTPWVRFKLWFWGVKVGRRLVCHGNVYINNRGIIDIGDDVILSSGWIANPVGSAQSMVFQVQKGAILRIGSKCGISNTVICCKQSIILKDGVFIGGGCSIYDNDFHSLYFKDRLSNQGNIKSLPIIIKQGAWVGGHCILLKGVTVGKNSVIGAGSIVTKNIADNVIAAGIPAKKIKKIVQTKHKPVNSKS
jgi:acetyltransferase-like isoleucine patch superfamily enzyme